MLAGGVGYFVSLYHPTASSFVSQISAPALLLALCSGGVVGIRDRARAAAAFVGLRIKNLR